MGLRRPREAQGRRALAGADRDREDRGRLRARDGAVPAGDRRGTGVAIVLDPPEHPQRTDASRRRRPPAEDATMAIDPTALGSRRALLAGALGGLGAVVAGAL